MTKFGLLLFKIKYLDIFNLFDRKEQKSYKHNFAESPNQ